MLDLLSWLLFVLLAGATPSDGRFSLENSAAPITIPAKKVATF
jgi:hypothetical protein